MKILLIGARGNIGQRLLKTLSAQGHTVTGADLPELDMTQLEATSRFIGDLEPELVIHAAGMTNVDQCAKQPDEALRVNGIGTKNVALVCQRYSAALCYFSTNEVFDGERGTPYLEYDPPRPINPYGYSKWVGEQVVRELLPQHYIVRTSWVFSPTGSNFLQRIVAKAAAGEPISVVTNEVASPTCAHDLVEALSRLLQLGGVYGTYHLVNDGWASRYEFAHHILDCYGYYEYPITPVISAQYPRPSRPPVYSALTNFMAAHMGIQLQPWRDAVAAFVARERVADTTT